MVESTTPKFSLYGSINKFTRTDIVFFPSLQFSKGLVFARIRYWFYIRFWLVDITHISCSTKPFIFIRLSLSHWVDLYTLSNVLSSGLLRLSSQYLVNVIIFTICICRSYLHFLLLLHLPCEFIFCICSALIMLDLI